MRDLAEAFNKIERSKFLPDAVSDLANSDRALTIGHGQTNSQPTVVRKMLEWLDPQEGEKVLDVGSGSGWTTALLAYLVGKEGVVHAVELIPELLNFGRDNCENAGVENAFFHMAEETLGYVKEAPYDRILVSAATNKVPIDLIDQLKVGGKMVIPVGNTIIEISKKSQKDYRTKTHHGFVFVPLLRG